ncbi:Protein IQ-DOMAIN like [Actinidia chinensis var. chinensis]|uniref:Protein IQ-DOMAIN like n=1 Tax=Actinidia chinensis var. chinensis TaxID=1590841 RepID=A0A2R6RSF0_ACTCC|nr:Protein IQ-DOMAIN like [Actinidia chinensis var. chinensis]
MGKIGGNSWLNAVKKAFRSPTKDNEKRSSRRREGNEKEEEEKKRGKTKFFSRKSLFQETTIQHNEAEDSTASSANSSVTTTLPTNSVAETADAEQRRAIAVAMATTAAAEAAVATAQAAVEIIRLTRPSILVREHHAAIAIQTAFRGYLARRALRALKGLVKLQALVRGHNVRKRAKMTLQCMQALVRAQARTRDQRKRLSYQGSIDSAFSDPNCLWGSHFADRKSISRDGSGTADDWHDHRHVKDETQATSKKTTEAALKREKSLTYAFLNQMWRSDQNLIRGSQELEEKPRLSDHWMRMKRWEETGRTSYDQRETVKTVEVDISRPYSYTAPNFQRLEKQNYRYQQEPCPQFVPSPLRRTRENLFSCTTLSPSKTKPLTVHTASPRCPRQERNYPKAWTPTLRSACYYDANADAASVPNYMSATESAKARIRPQSAPRQRPRTPEREKPGSAKKRLSFPAPDPYNGIGTNELATEYAARSPSCKSIYRDRSVKDKRSTASSCYDSYGDEVCDEVSSFSTSGVRSWLK